VLLNYDTFWGYIVERCEMGGSSWSDRTYLCHLYGAVKMGRYYSMVGKKAHMYKMDYLSGNNMVQ